MRGKISTLVFLTAICWTQAQVPTAPTPGQPPATTTPSTVPTIPTIPTAPTGDVPVETTTTTTIPPPITPGPTPPPPDTTTTTTPPPPPPETTTTTTVTTPDPITCPSTGVHNLPTDHCQYFVTCINGNRFDGRCQDGFLFDTGRSTCEPAGAVDCGQRIRP